MLAEVDCPESSRPRYPAILLCCSMVILGGAFSTYLLGRERNRKLKAGATIK
jgi:hypothetical protein